MSENYSKTVTKNNPLGICINSLKTLVAAGLSLQFFKKMQAKACGYQDFYKIISLTLITLSVEIFALVIFYNLSGTASLLLINLGIAILFSRLLIIFTPEKLKGLKWQLLVLFIGNCAFIPLLGFLVVGVAMIVINWFQDTLIVTHIRIVPPVEYKEISVMSHRNIEPPSDIWNAVHNKNLSTPDRLKVLSKLNINKSRIINTINWNIAHEENDELRLYGFKVIDFQETKINNEIYRTLLKLKSTTVPLYKAKLEKHLAFLYWLFTDLHLLAHKDVFSFAINSALNYALLAIKTLPEDINLWVLLGSIYTLQDDRAKAFDALNRATRLGVADSNTYLYLSALSFKKRNFEELRGYLAMSGVLQNTPSTNKIINFWQKR